MKTQQKQKYIYLETNISNNATCHTLSFKNNNKHDANRTFKKHKCATQREADCLICQAHVSVHIHCGMVSDTGSNFCQFIFVSSHSTDSVLSEMNTRMRRCIESLQMHSLLLWDFTFCSAFPNTISTHKNIILNTSRRYWKGMWAGILESV
jgi:hypothetical protein